jgi:hypothetical protein
MFMLSAPSAAHHERDVLTTTLSNTPAISPDSKPACRRTSQALTGDLAHCGRFLQCMSQHVCVIANVVTPTGDCLILLAPDAARSAMVSFRRAGTESAAEPFAVYRRI